MDMVDLRYLSIAVETGNFSRAALSLNIKPSTISRRIARLEDELGVTIFERGSFGIRLTAAGREVMVPVRRTLDGFDRVRQVGKSSGAGMTGHVRLGVRMPPIGEPLQPLLAAWHDQHPDVVLTLYELNDNEISAALAERTFVAALPHGHILASYEALTWTLLGDQILLTQGWADSHSDREFYASFLGDGVKFSSHPASKQSVMALVGAGFGITLAAQSQAEVVFPGVVYRPILEDDAWLQVEL